MKYRELTRAIEGKVPGTAPSGGHERNKWALIDGRKILRVTFPKVHGGDVARGTLNSIRKQLRLNTSEFEDFVDCSMTGPAYEAHLRAMIDRQEL